MPDSLRSDSRPNVAEPTPELRAYAHEHALQYFRLADARLTSATPVLSQIVPVGLLAAMVANWPSLDDTEVVVGCAVASLLYFCALWVVLAYSSAYEHLVAIGTEYRQKAGGDGTDWDELIEKFTPSVSKVLNLGVLAPGVFRPLAWMYFAGIVASQGAAFDRLVANHDASDLWIPVDIAVLVVLAAFATHWQYLSSTKCKWERAKERSDAAGSGATPGGRNGGSRRPAPAPGPAPSGGNGTAMRRAGVRPSR